MMGTNPELDGKLEGRLGEFIFLSNANHRSDLKFEFPFCSGHREAQDDICSSAVSSAQNVALSLVGSLSQATSIGTSFSNSGQGRES
jgi:hypothetical protein